MKLSKTFQRTPLGYTLTNLPPGGTWNREKFLREHWLWWKLLTHCRPNSLTLISSIYPVIAIHAHGSFSNSIIQKVFTYIMYYNCSELLSLNVVLDLLQILKCLWECMKKKPKYWKFSQFLKNFLRILRQIIVTYRDCFRVSFHIKLLYKSIGKF